MGEQLGSAQAHELGDEPRQLREAMGMTCRMLAERVGWSASKVSRIENGLTTITELDVVRYAAHCGVKAEYLDELLDMCREPGAPGYWLSKRLSTLIFHESAAAASSSYDPLVVPGLLQTEEYAAALIGSDRPWLVTARMERQRVLHGRKFEFFVHEQALRLPVGSNPVMNEQLLMLTLLADQPKIRIRVVPTALGARSMFGGELVLFRYAAHQPLAYLDHGPFGLFLQEHAEVVRYQKKLIAISDVALDRGESRKLLAALASEFDRPEVSRDAPDHLAEEQL